VADFRIAGEHFVSDEALNELIRQSLAQVEKEETPPQFCGKTELCRAAGGCPECLGNKTETSEGSVRQGG